MIWHYGRQGTLSLSRPDTVRVLIGFETMRTYRNAYFDVTILIRMLVPTSSAYKDFRTIPIGDGG